MAQISLESMRQLPITRPLKSGLIERDAAHVVGHQREALGVEQGERLLLHDAERCVVGNRGVDEEVQDLAGGVEILARGEPMPVAPPLRLKACRPVRIGRADE